MAVNHQSEKRRCRDNRRVIRSILILVNAMKINILKTLLLLAVTTGGLLLGGCTYMEDGESNVPWSRPAEWENQLPGLGGR